MKEAFPDAWYTTWDRLLEELEAAYASAPEHPVVPRSRPEGYSGTPLPRKLGVSEGSTLALMEAPEGLEHTLGPLPAGVRLLRDECPAGALVLWFVRSLHELHAGMAEMAPRAEGGRLWIAWPKKSSPLAGEVTQNEVRELALAARLVDFKVCAIDADWSGLRFTRGR
ncbi:MAG: DUF3052 family protein [Armatimonadetes bacterium]|nr:DUF3052 family protein [Armatimonadota bacterium]